MGTDYSSGYAMSCELENMLKIIKAKNKKSVIEAIQCFHDSVVDGQYTSDKAKKYVSSLNEIKPNIKLADLKQIIIDYHEVEGDTGKYEGDCRFTNDLDGWDLIELWQDIIEASREELPDLSEIRIFDSYRQHYDCPLGVMCFVFNREDCYERTLSDKGKSLKKLCGGYLSEISWTDVSY